MLKKMLMNIVLCTSMLAVTACGSSSKKEISAATSATETSKEMKETKTEETGTETQTFEKPKEAIIMKIGVAVAETHPQYKALEFFKEKLEEKTNGGIEVQLFANSQMGNERDMIEGLQMGSLEGAKTSTAVLSGFAPAYMAFDLPYVFTSKEKLFEVLDGEIGDEYKQMVEDVGLHTLTFFYAGARDFYTTKEIHTAADLKGQKIRVMESPLMVASINAMGAIATPLPASEVYSAIQQDVVQGAENSPAICLSQKHYEVTKYFTLTEHFMTPDVINLSKAWYDSLSDEYRQAVDECGELLRLEERRLWDEAEKESLAELEKNGMVINEVDKSSFSDAVKPVYTEYESQIGKELMDRILAVTQN